jgi:hypothetical protein
MKRYLTITVLVVALSTFAGLRVSRANQNPPAVSLCELMGNWKKYNRRKVRVHAFYRVREGGTGLYDPACKEGELLADVIFQDHTRGSMKRLNKILTNGRRAEVILEGIFHGPEPFDHIDPRLPATVREAMRGSHQRYGHLGGFDMQIVVSRVIKAVEVLPTQVKEN